MGKPAPILYGIIFWMIDDRQNFPVLGDLLDETKAQSALQALGFADWKTASTIFRRMDLVIRRVCQRYLLFLIDRARFLCRSRSFLGQF